MTLALLLTAVTGAWAQSYEAKVFDVPASWEEDNTHISAADLPKDFVQITKDEAKALAVPDGDVVLVYGFVGENVLMMAFDNGTAIPNDDDDGAPEARGNFIMFQTMAKVCYTTPAGPKVAWNAATKTGTFSMPGSDVVLTPIYAKAAAFATTGTEPEVKPLLPEAAEGVIAGTDASLIAEGTGIVAFAGTSTEDTQGTLMYAIGTSATEAPALTAFSATVPTAKDIADDGATLYVWYYIQGADAPEGVAATLDNTFDNTEPACLTVQVLTNKFDIQFNAANANTIEAGKATVTVDGTDKTSDITDGKLQGVKMGSEVKVKANTGYKFRKVEVKKKATGKPLANATTEDLGKVVGADGNIYANKDAAEAANTTAVAMICYVNEGHGLALALSDISSYGNSWDNSSTNNGGKTAAELCSAWNTSKAVTGATWKLASLSEMNLMINAAGNYAALRDGFSAVGGTNMIDEYYWLSDESSSDYAENFNFSYGSWSQEFKDCSYKVRACLAF
jgi:hypothetical protein